jgi:hypothetical protein
MISIVTMFGTIEGGQWGETKIESETSVERIL